MDFEATARSALHEALQQLGTAADAMRHARRPEMYEAIATAQRQVGALYDAACAFSPLDAIVVTLTSREAEHPDVFEEAFSAVARANGATEVIARRKPGGVMVFMIDRCNILPSALPDIARKAFRRMMNR